MNACTALAAAIDDAALGASPTSALATHLTTCAECAALLERRRALAQRIDLAVMASVRREPPLGLAERIVARAASRRSRRWNPRWLVLPAGAVLAAALVVFVSSALGGLRGTVTPADVAALAAWRSPTASLLVSRAGVLGAPFTLTDRRSST